MSDTLAPPLPSVLAGPVLRRCTPDRLLIWLVGSRELNLTLHLDAGDTVRTLPLSESCRRLRFGQHAVLHLLDIALPEPLPPDRLIRYDLTVDGQGIAQWAPHLLYPGEERPNFVLRERLDNLLHGSCRKPHSACPDGLLQVDALLARTTEPQARPSLLLMSGDQVYADDVAGPTLAAIHRLIERLGLFGEYLDGAVVSDTDQLYRHPDTFYRREALLPAFRRNEPLRERFFGGVEKPIFTSANAHNHLISLAEMLAMYLLVWSPTPWSLIDLQAPALAPADATRYEQERGRLGHFIDGLPQIARSLAHLPTLMIFDDHDVSDDWNLSASWETSAYGHPFSRRIIGNALLGYLLGQGWGNDPDACAEPLEGAARLLASVDPQGKLPGKAHDDYLTALFHFNRWGYVVPGEPALIVLDTRTQRWRSERHPSRPSGLMDWEALSDFQQQLLDHRSAVIVSATPVFGVKLIEVIQRIFTWFGHPLLVDAENWMAHPGASHTLLNIFCHSRTPGNYVILSGDVHYSFMYDVAVRRARGPRIWQITSSGIKNEFPRRLLDWFDRLNRWLYAPRSPLNLLTKRRHLAITPRIPSRSQRGERLWNGAGIGQVLLDGRGRPREVLQLNADGSEPTRFVATKRD